MMVVIQGMKVVAEITEEHRVSTLTSFMEHLG